MEDDYVTQLLEDSYEFRCNQFYDESKEYDREDYELIEEEFNENRNI